MGKEIFPSRIVILVFDQLNSHEILFHGQPFIVYIWLKYTLQYKRRFFQSIDFDLVPLSVANKTVCHPHIVF